VGCDLCEAACPSRCIKVVSEEDPETPLRRIATEFYIDITKCVFCGFCVEACPVNALAMTKMYEYSTRNKRDLMFDKDRLYQIGDQLLAEAKSYLVAHHQEESDEAAREYRYKFPSAPSRKG
jgi:NADH-quinone oxidoreductase subunit I